jgi:hypothetical protein
MYGLRSKQGESSLAAGVLYELAVHVLSLLLVLVLLQVVVLL